MCEVVTRAMAQTPEERAINDDIRARLREMRGWPVLSQGGLHNPYKGYLRAILLAQAGRGEEALEELERTLELADGGIVGNDLAGLPPEVSPYFSELRELPGFGAWLAKYSQRREAMRQRMIEVAEGA